MVPSKDSTRGASESQVTQSNVTFRKVWVEPPEIGSSKSLAQYQRLLEWQGITSRGIITFLMFPELSLSQTPACFSGFSLVGRWHSTNWGSNIRLPIDEIGQDRAALLWYKLQNRQGFILCKMLYYLKFTAGKRHLKARFKKKNKKIWLIGWLTQIFQYSFKAMLKQINFSLTLSVVFATNLSAYNSLQWGQFCFSWMFNYGSVSSPNRTNKSPSWLAATLIQP